MARRSHWLVRVTVAAIVSVPSIVSAAVDMTGAWWVHATNFTSLPPVVQYWTQTGTSVTISNGFTGTINPNNGMFSMTAPSSPVCPDNTLNGTASLDNETCWSATFDGADVIRNQSGSFKGKFKTP